MKFCIDAGHGGSDPGASNGGLIEKDMTLISAKACAYALERCGQKVVLTRLTDAYVSIGERVALANQSKADAVISIHYNAGGGKRAEVIHSIYVGKGIELARSINQQLQLLGQTSTREISRKGANGDYFGMIRDTDAPAVIVEPCFIDNAIDRKFADTKAEQETIGENIAHGICNAYGIEWKEGTQIRVDGKVINIDAVLINNQNYIRLRDLEKAGLKVVYNDMPELITKEAR